LFLTAGRQNGRRSTAYRRSGIGSDHTGKVQENLPKEDAIEVMGKVVEKFKAGMFSIELEAGRAVLATMAGRLRRNRIKIMNGDRVTLELSPYDLTKGRITYRHK
jgi:translation initiation factor IF-1